MKNPKIIIFFVVLLFGGYFLKKVVSNITKIENRLQRNYQELIDFGIIAENVPITKRTHFSHKGDRYNYFYTFEGDVTNFFSIWDRDNHPVYDEGDALTILYSEQSPKIHTVLKIKDDLTLNLQDSTSIIFYKRGVDTYGVDPTIVLLQSIKE